MGLPETDRAIELLRKALAGGLSGRELDDEWPRSRDRLLRSIHFWLWHRYDDESAEPAGLAEEDRDVICRIIAFLESDAKFMPREDSLLLRVRHVWNAGVEWWGAELPWHDKWPFAPGATLP